MDKKITNTKIKLLTLLTICFNAALCTFDINAMNISSAALQEQQELLDAQRMLASVKKLDEFIVLPDSIIIKLTSNTRKKLVITNLITSDFITDAKLIYQQLSIFSSVTEITNLKDLLAVSETIHLKPSLKEDLTKALMILDPFNSIPPDLFLDNPKLHISTPGFGSHIMSVLKSDKAENAGISLEGLYKALSSDAIGVLKCSLSSADDYASALGWLLFQHNSTYDYLCAIKGLLYSDGIRSSENDFHLLDSNFIFPVFKNLIKIMLSNITSEN